MALASPSGTSAEQYGYVEHSVPLPGRSLRLHYLEWLPAPEESGPSVQTPTILLLHGLGDCAAVWSHFGACLQREHYRVIAPDLRGHGDSDKPQSGYDFDAIIDDLEALLTELNIGHPIIAMGHSWTGKLVPLWVKRSPDKIKTQVLVDPFFIGRLPSLWKLTFPLFYRVLPFLKMMGPFATQEAAEAQAKTLKQYRNWSPLQQHVFQRNLEYRADKTWGSKLAIAARNGIFEAVMLVAGLTVPLNTPALVLIAEAGLNRSDWQLKPYYQYLSCLTLKKIPGNHWNFLTHPETFAQIVISYLREFNQTASSQNSLNN